MELYRLDQVCKINPPKEIDEGITEVSFIPMEAVSTDGRVDISRTISADAVKNYSVFRNRDVLFAKITPCMENGKGGIVDSLKNGYGAGSTEFIVIRPDEAKVCSEWIQLFISQASFRLECRNHMTGSAGQKRVPPKYLAACNLPVPPLPEQRRIVSRIEEMFSELDNSVNTLQKTKSLLGVYRQAVLKEAFDSIDARTVSIQSICASIVDCPHSTPKWTDKGYLCLRTTNFRRGFLDLTERNYVTKEIFDIRNARLVPLPGDVLYSREGAILGLACIIPDDTYACLGQRMMLLRPGEELNNKFLMHYLNSPRLTNYVASVTGGSASPHINVGDIKQFQIPHPSMLRQKEIVDFIESRLSICDSIAHTVNTALQKAEAMRQSILKQAFEGNI